MGISTKLIGVGLCASALAMAACAPSNTIKTREDLVTSVNCMPQRFEVYFTEGRSTLTPAAMQAISMTAQRLQGCHIRSVAVTGLSSATGTSAANLNLSEQRAQAVSEAMSTAGWPVPVFDVQAVGDEGARAGNVSEPLRRRTEVVVDAAPRR